MVMSAPNQYSAVIASYKYQDEIFGQLACLKESLSAIYRPNRKSGMESLCFDFSGEKKPSKGLVFLPVI
jgi:hypothetical protein